MIKTNKQFKKEGATQIEKEGKRESEEKER